MTGKSSRRLSITHERRLGNEEGLAGPWLWESNRLRPARVGEGPIEDATYSNRRV